jgi:hypothetical protein
MFNWDLGDHFTQFLIGFLLQDLSNFIRELAA